ncbi:hypothetical protein SAMD00019534_092480, partial [Acytostelium subglobosum LB1]|uniref:hypothetical protein n=1 Tax=Acytostelium subglobosum LB1 TaxID=1410327 RepID=UPI000644C8A3
MSFNLNYLLGSIDCVLFLWALFQLIRIQQIREYPFKKLTPKWIFHFIIAVAMFVRSVFFFVTPSMDKEYIIINIWYNLSTILLFLAYGCLLMFWIELYTRFSKPFITSMEFWHKWKPYIIAFNCTLVSLILTWIMTYVFWARGSMDRQNITLQISEGFVSALFLAAGLGFFIFGFLLFYSFKTIGINYTSESTTLSQEYLRAPPEAIRAAVVGTVCTICFCFRSSVMIYSIHVSMLDPAVSTNGTFEFDWEVELAYFFVTEILPTIMMLFRMRKMKQQKSFSSNVKRYSSSSATTTRGASSSVSQSYRDLVYNSIVATAAEPATTTPFDNRRLYLHNQLAYQVGLIGHTRPERGW